MRVSVPLGRSRRTSVEGGSVAAPPPAGPPLPPPRPPPAPPPARPPPPVVAAALSPSSRYARYLPPSRANLNERTRGITVAFPSAVLTSVSEFRGVTLPRAKPPRAAPNSERGAN